VICCGTWETGVHFLTFPLLFGTGGESAMSWQLQGAIAEVNLCMPAAILNYSTFSPNEMEEHRLIETLTQQIQARVL